MFREKTRFVLEIEEQPEALRRVVKYYRAEGVEVLGRAASLCRCKDGGRIVFTGMGTSLYAATLVYSLLADSGAALPIVIEAGELLHHCSKGIEPEDVVVAISQSGESFETVKIAEKLRGHKLLAITNILESPLAQRTSLSLPILAGTEESISSKSYTNKLAVLLLLANEIFGKKRNMVIEGLLRCAESMEEFLEGRRDEIREAAEFLREANFLYFISRGPSMAAAQQAALTWMEGVHMPTAAMPGASFRHGPYELLRPGFHAICYAPDSQAGFLVEKMAEEMAGFGARVVIFSGRRVKSDNGLFVIELEPGDDYLLPLTAAIPQELLLAQMAKDRGWTAGVFERGSKVTRHQ